MAKNIDLITRYDKAVDERFSQESKRNLVTNSDYNWEGAKTIKVYKINTADMNDYNRDGDIPEGQWSRYGVVKPLDAVTESMTLTRDRSFTFMLDKMDIDETGASLEASTALARQVSEVIIPEYDTYVYGVMAENAGETITKKVTKDTIYNQILEGTNALDNAMVPETQRVIIITPDSYKLLKESQSIVLDTESGQEMRSQGVIGFLDGCAVIKVPANRLPKDTAFMIAHPVATVAPVKLESFVTHEDPPGLSGYLVEGRIYYDAFVLDNKKEAIYLHKTIND